MMTFNPAMLSGFSMTPAALPSIGSGIAGMSGYQTALSGAAIPTVGQVAPQGALGGALSAFKNYMGSPEQMQASQSAAQVRSQVPQGMAAPSISLQAPAGGFQFRTQPMQSMMQMQFGKARGAFGGL